MVLSSSPKPHPINDIDDKAYLLSSVLTEGDFYEGDGKWGCQLNPASIADFKKRKVFLLDIIHVFPFLTMHFVVMFKTKHQPQCR